MREPLAQHMERIQQKICLLKSKDVELEVFGSGEHRYKMSQCVHDAQLYQIERRLGISFPEDYAYFLTRICNGPVGPLYGLYALQESLDEAGMAILTSPFPSTRELGFPNHLRIANEQMQEFYNGEFLMDGSLPICHEGCGYVDYLVICGPERGRIWQDGRCSDYGISPLRATPDSPTFTFASWYEHWLDESLQKVEQPT